MDEEGSRGAESCNLRLVIKQAALTKSSQGLQGLTHNCLLRVTQTLRQNRGDKQISLVSM